MSHKLRLQCYLKAGFLMDVMDIFLYNRVILPKNPTTYTLNTSINSPYLLTYYLNPLVSIIQTLHTGCINVCALPCYLVTIVPS